MKKLLKIGSENYFSEELRQKIEGMNLEIETFNERITASEARTAALRSPVANFESGADFIASMSEGEKELASLCIDAVRLVDVKTIIYAEMNVEKRQEAKRISQAKTDRETYLQDALEKLSPGGNLYANGFKTADKELMRLRVSERGAGEKIAYDSELEKAPYLKFLESKTRQG